MTPHPWHQIIIAYRIEDSNGNSPFIISSSRNHFSENVYPDYEDYRYAYINMNKFLEPEYYPYYMDDQYSLFEYLISPCMASVDSTGAVSFRSQSVLSKTKLMKGMVTWAELK
jgi:hypothetical protein